MDQLNTFLSLATETLIGLLKMTTDLIKIPFTSPLGALGTIAIIIGTCFTLLFKNKN